MVQLQKTRYPFIDWLRGFAILLMVIYHFCYDLDYFRYIDTAFGRGYWIPFRYVIVISFLLLVGVSLTFVHRNGIKWNSVYKRSGQLLLACIAVTASGYFIAPDKLTVFGILHFILVASWLALPLVYRPRAALLVGSAIFVIGHMVKSKMFEPTWIHWIGMVETKRPALDYVPLFPWLGVVFIGICFGHWLLASDQGQKLAKVDLSSSQPKLSYLHRGMETAGQHSLVIYLVHQPLMFALFLLVEKLK